MPAAIDPNGHGEARPAAARRILVVDDHRDAADSLAMLLEIEGYAVDVAYDGTRALRVAAERRPDVVLLDIGLPGMDGYEVGRLLRRQVGGDFVLVALTGYGRDVDRARSAAAGFDRHVVKPLDTGALAALLAADP